MNITVKHNNEEFTLYNPDFVPQQGDTIIMDEKVYTVERRVWDDDNNETILYATLNYASIPANVSDEEILEMLYKEMHNVGLREAKDWVDNHC